MVARKNWAPHVNRILRSRHYTWIGDGLAGHNVEEAVTQILVDAMHLCRHEGLDWDGMLASASRQLHEEERIAS